MIEMVDPQGSCSGQEQTCTLGVGRVGGTSSLQA